MAKSDKLFVTEAECAERIGLSTEQFKFSLLAATKAGFPAPDDLFGKRRYWPAVVSWLDRRYGLGGGGLAAPPGLDGVENWNGNTTKVQRSKR